MVTAAATWAAPAVTKLMVTAGWSSVMDLVQVLNYIELLMNSIGP